MTATSSDDRATGVRRWVGALVLGGGLVAVAACGSTSSPAGPGTSGSSTPGGTSGTSGSGGSGGSTGTTAVAGRTGTTTATGAAWAPTVQGPATVALPSGPVDQTSPKGTNGVAWDGRRLWVADLAGGEILVVDPRTGAIEGRFGAAQGVTKPDDLAIGPDGAVYWTGFEDGIVGRLGPDGTSTTIAQVGPGANPIAVSPDGSLYVGRAVTADGLYRIDPRGAAAPVTVAESVGNVNAFAFGPDGALYGPSYKDQQGSLVRIDPQTGQVTQVVGGLGFPSAVKFGPDGRAYVLTAVPVGVVAVDVATGQATPYATPATPAVDNIASDGDGSFVVSSFNGPQLSIIPPAGGEVRTVRIGQG